MEGFRDRFRNSVQKEPVDPLPHELAHPELRPPTLREQIQTAIRSEISLAAEAKGYDTFDQADDFQEDDPDHQALTAYEMVLMTPENDETLDGPPPEPAAAGSPDPAPSPGTPPSPGPPGPSEEPGSPPLDPPAPAKPPP